jgi:hypothetical protein
MSHQQYSSPSRIIDSAAKIKRPNVILVNDGFKKWKILKENEEIDYNFSNSSRNGSLSLNHDNLNFLSSPSNDSKQSSDYDAQSFNMVNIMTTKKINKTEIVLPRKFFLALSDSSSPETLTQDLIHQQKISSDLSQSQIARRELYCIIKNCGITPRMNETQAIMKEVLLIRFPTGTDLLGGLFACTKKIKRSSISDLNECFRKWIKLEGREKINKYVSEVAKKFVPSNTSELAL